MRLKSKSSIYLVIILIMFLFVGSVYFYSKTKNEATLPDDEPPNYPFRITGFRFESYTESGTRLSIQSDALYLTKKKIGFFRFGLLNELRLSNAKINIYDRTKNMHRNFSPVGPSIDPPASSVQSVSYSRPPKEKKSELPQVAPTLPPEFAQVSNVIPITSPFNAGFFVPNLPLNRIASVRMAPVDIAYFRNGKPAVRIRAESAEISPADKEFIFRGSVEVVSENRTLKTEQLKYEPELNQISSDAGIYINGQTVRRFSNTFAFDLFLKSVNS